MQKFICYTDGSYKPSYGKLGQGGWASIILDEKECLIDRLYQGFENTTNNRMELRAILETLKYFEEPSEITIVSDSQYAIGLLTNGTAESWVMNNQLDRINIDLLFPIVDLLHKHKVSFQWVKGHSGNKWNEEADKWCTFAASCLNLSKDIWTTYSQQNSSENVGI